VGCAAIHGELLKLGMVVSERTVSRYLPDRRRLPSQTWRTFLANHRLALASASTVTSANALGDNEAVDARDVLRRRVPSLPTRTCVNQWVVVDWSPPLQRTSLGSRVAQDLLPDGRRAQSGRDPPEGWAVALVPEAYGRRSLLRRLRLFHRLMNSLQSSVLLTAGSPSPVLIGLPITSSAFSETRNVFNGC
jgi:hypothetical protein